MISEDSPRAKLIRAIIDQYNKPRVTPDYLEHIIWAPSVQEAFNNQERVYRNDMRQAILEAID